MHSIEVFRLFLITLGAYFIPLISRRLMLPTAVGEVFFGMLIGSFLHSATDSAHYVGFLSELGFLLLMYIAGMEIDLSAFFKLPRKQLLIYFSFAIFTIIGAVIATVLSGLPPFFILVLMTSAIGLLFSVLKDVDLVKHEIGQKMLLLGTIGEVLTLLGVTLFSLAYKTGVSLESAKHLLFILLFMIVVFIVLTALKLIIWWNPSLKELFMSVGNPSEIGVRANLVNMFFFIALAALVDLELIVGAFIGGIVFAQLFSEREEMLERLSSFGYGFLIPIFFIEVGSRFKISDFLNLEVIKFSLVIIALIFVVRLFAALPLLLGGSKKREVLLVALSQSFPLTLLVAVAAIGYSANIIDKNQSSVIILTSIVSAVIFPWAMKIIIKYTMTEDAIV